MKRYKMVVYVPESHADQLREAMGNAGAGKIGNYTHCTFTIKGTGRFKPEEGANPTIGEVGKLEAVAEDRIETVCEESVLKDVLAAIRKVHPYEEPATDVYPIEVVE
ncbi:MAG TPA: YqfO family protein [Candidatus Paceibacterota bacterium]|nr:YqfO family protein [Candidatus Paceibacterota bacterium]